MARPVFAFRNRLAIRLALLLTLALAPLGSIAIYSEYESWRAEREAAEAALIARTVDAVSGPYALLESAMASARRLGADLVARDDLPDASCGAYLTEHVDASGLFGFAGFIEPSGVMRCSTLDAVLDVSDHPGFIDALSDPSPHFSSQPNGAVGERPVVLANWPVFDGDVLQGFMSVSILRDQLDMISIGQEAGTEAKATVLLNHRGTPLNRAGLPDGQSVLPPPDLLDTLMEAPRPKLRAQSENGEARVFTMAELTPGRLYALGSWEPAELPMVGGLPFWRFAFPVLMWVASIAVVMLAMHYLVVRHLRLINSQLRSFALGHRDTFRRLPEDAPQELREIDSTFTKMALLIRRDEAERDEALREKTTLLKEVHHRVKNNLQLIASILNLQGRRVTDPAARAILQGVQGRVRSLATIHRSFYEQKLTPETEASTLFETILAEMLSIARTGPEDLKVEQHFDPVVIAPDKIVPTALLFAEALTNALKYAAPPAEGTPPLLHVTCRNHGSHIEFRLRNSVAPGQCDDTAGGLGQELMTAFALQIHAELETGRVEDDLGHGWETKLRLSLPQGGETPPRAGAEPGRVL